MLFSFITVCQPAFAGWQDSTLNPLEEFEEFTVDTVVTTLSSSSHVSPTSSKESGGIYWTLTLLFFTILAGVFVRYKYTRQFRSVFLVFSVAILGFYAGACPCAIQSLQNNILLVSGKTVNWHSLIYFAGLIPVTYLFGRVFCGWICQLGALQEFIFQTSRFKLLQNKRSQQIMRKIRIAVVLLLVIQLLITGTNLYKHIDPFRVIYNFYSSYPVGWWLVAVLVISSFLIYRPFCKTICPVGLLLGLISKIPGASVLGVKESCITCKRCNNQCSIRAITHENKVSILDNQECIRCGECLNGCVKDALSFSRNSQKHPSKVKCKATGNI